MTQLWDFTGGIHPPENKHQSTARPIRKGAMPDRLVLPLQQLLLMIYPDLYRYCKLTLSKMYYIRNIMTGTTTV